ncbi:MAG: hypothetical protein JWQ92_1381 [Amnibacterium sp.]|nr:hypothetical protein [Amnibacterium sp.]
MPLSGRGGRLSEMSADHAHDEAVVLDLRQARHRDRAHGTTDLGRST